jgi:hypothetical protein
MCRSLCCFLILQIGQEELEKHEYLESLRIQYPFFEPHNIFFFEFYALTLSTYIPQLGFEIAIPLPENIDEQAIQEILLQIEAYGFRYQVIETS